MKHSLEKFNKLVDALQELPTIGQKSAIRLAYHMVMKDNFTALKIAHARVDQRKSHHNRQRSRPVLGGTTSHR